MRPLRPLAFILLVLTLLAGCTPAGHGQATSTTVPVNPPAAALPALVVPAALAQAAGGLGGLLHARIVAGDAAAEIAAGRAPWGLLAVDPTHPLPPGLVTRYAWADPGTPVPVQEYLLAPPEIRASATSAGGQLPAGVALMPYGDLAPPQAALPVDGILPTQESIASGQYPWAHRLVLVGQPLPPGVTPEQIAAPELAAMLGMVERVRITAVGDYMLARGVQHRVEQNGGDPTWPVALVKDRLKQPDITFANLESPIGVTGTPLPNKLIWFRAPPQSVQALTASGVTAVTVANNHILDYDRPNFLETLDLLDKAAIAHVGGGKNLAEARRPLIISRKGVRIAFLGYSEFAPLYWDAQHPISFLATDSLPGVPPIQDQYLVEDIKAARAQADIVIVTFHWGVEFTNHPTAEQQRIAHLCVDSGAQVVLGYHPHAIQGPERYKDGFIVYSLGNFIMDQFDPVTLESIMVDLDVEKSGVKNVRFTPVMLENFRPHVAAGDEAARWWRKWATLREGNLK